LNQWKLCGLLHTIHLHASHRRPLAGLDLAGAGDHTRDEALAIEVVTLAERSVCFEICFALRSKSLLTLNQRSSQKASISYQFRTD